MLYDIDHQCEAIKRHDRIYYNWRLYRDFDDAKAVASADVINVLQNRSVVRVEGGFTVCGDEDLLDTFAGHEVVYHEEAPVVPIRRGGW